MRKKRILIGGNRGRRAWRKYFLDRKARRLFRAPPRRRYRGPRGIVPNARLNQHIKGSVKTAPGNSLELTLPEQLDFEQNYESTASHFYLLRKAARGSRRIRTLRFDLIRNISPSAALVLASEVDRWNQRIGGRLRSRDETWDDQIRRLLCEMGYFELLGLPRPITPPPAGNTTFLQFKSGIAGAEIDPGKLAQDLRIEIEQIVGRPIRKRALFEGLSEAITNVAQHAYPPWIVTRKQWWLSASYNREEQRLTVMFYDQGAGIPTTLERLTWVEKIRAKFVTWSDARKIRAAMAYGRSRTERRERGKGLKNLRQFAKAHSSGQMTIYSLRGCHRMLFTNGSRSSKIDRNHENSIGGTLVEWSVIL